MEKYSNIIMYYFSGTGNAKHVAKWIANTSNENNFNVQAIDISKSERRITGIPENSLIGFISPTHGFNFPPIMFHFILRFPHANNNSVFIVNTRGGLKFSKFFIPGLSGLAQFFSALILKCKGYKIVGMHPIDLPSNWISLHPGLKPKVISSIYDRRKKEVLEFANKILIGKKDLKAFWDIIQDLLISPVAILYYFFGRFMIAKTFIASKDCNNCNLCIRECPVNAIKTINNRPFWTYKCESCMHCMNICPKRAIETAHGFIAGLLVMFNFIILYIVFSLFRIDQVIAESLPSEIGKIAVFLFETLIFLGFLMLSYRIMHFLLKFSFFERIIVYTSLTKYKFWRRYKFQKLKNL
ncbi:MAG: EFR1 family ferrodoxin [Bacteroidales bacterium]